MKELEGKCREKLLAQGFEVERIRTEAFLHMRYSGTDCALMCSEKRNNGDYMATFLERYKVTSCFIL